MSLRFLALVVGGVGAVLAMGWAVGHRPATNASECAERIARLQREVGTLDAAMIEAVERYSPSYPGRIDDLAVDAAAILRQLPGVNQVEVLVSVSKPQARIIHVRDWHTVPRELYAIDMRTAASHSLSDADIDELHNELLLQAELVQLEQMAALRCLIARHGLGSIHAEGLTEKGLSNYREMLGALRDIDQEVPKLRVKFHELLSLSKNTETDRLEQEVSGLIEQQRRRLLDLGAPGRLRLFGEITEVLPLDDEELLDQARPVTPDGKVQADPVKVEARHDGQVRNLHARGPFALIVLGGSHDLSESVRRLSHGKCEYIRVTTKKYLDLTADLPEGRIP